MLNKLISAVIIAVFTLCIFTLSNSAVAQEEISLEKSQKMIATKEVEKVAYTPPPTPADDTIRLYRRIENQIKQLTSEYGLSEKQAADVQKLYVDFELKQTQLRNQISSLAKERQEKFESILTPEQKEKVGEISKPQRREGLKSPRNINNNNAPDEIKPLDRKPSKKEMLDKKAK